MAYYQLFNQNEDYTAQMFRALFNEFYGQEGVIKGLDCAQSDTTEIEVTAGSALVEWGSTGQHHMVISDATVALNTGSNPTSTNEVRHLVYFEANDSELLGSGSVEAPEIQIASSSIGAPPRTLPSTPANAIPLWDITVDSGGLATAEFVDLRAPAAHRGDGIWYDYSPTINGWALSNGQLSTRYCRIGNTCIVNLYWNIGSGDSEESTLQVELPFAPLSTVNQLAFSGHGFVGKNSTSSLYPIGVRLVSSHFMQPFAFVAQSGDGYKVKHEYVDGTNPSPAMPFDFSSNDDVQWTFIYEIDTYGGAI